MTTTEEQLTRSTVLAAARLQLETERADLRATLDLPADDLDVVTRGALVEVEAALVRLAAGHYGVCTECTATIPHERLAVLPATRTCVGCRVRAEGG